ncbi:hypothetical protein ACC717_38405, partial [Rhizobium ruizarguesonis]
LHAPFLADPDRCSPYEPSSRQHLNPLYIAVDRLPGFACSPELERQLASLRQTGQRSRRTLSLISATPA